MGLTTGFASNYIDWDVRSTGSDSNGGGFDGVSGTPGTDRSQSDGPFITYSDLTIDATTNTKCTSSGNAFTSAHVGNIINVVSTDPAWAWGNRTGIITTTASSGLCGNGGTTPTALVNGVYPNNNATFLAVTLSSSYWLKFDFGSSVTLTSATWYQTAVAQGTWQWQGSPDNSSWTNIGSTFAIGASGTVLMTSMSANVTAYRYYRMLGVSGTTSNQWVYQMEFNLTFYSQRVLINSVTAGVATVDKVLGALSASSGAGYLGGSLATPAAALGLANGNGHQVFIKTATYTISTSLPYLPYGGGIRISGYGSTHNDGGTRPTLTTSASNVNMFTQNATDTWIDNLVLTCTWGTPTISLPGDAIPTSNANGRVYVTNCKISGFRYGVQPPNQFVSLRNTEIGGCYKGMYSPGGTQTSQFEIHHSWIHDCTSTGFQVPANAGYSAVISRSVFSGNAADGILFGGTDWNFSVVNCVFYGNGADAVYLSTNGATRSNLNNGTFGTFLFENNIVYGQSSGYGINMSGDVRSTNLVVLPIWCFRNNAYGANSTNFHFVSAGANDITLTGDPFTNAAAGDFTLNSTAGAGAACKGAGFQAIT